ncbi:hypothetical protein ACFL1Z_04750 [Thermodesulfobacteriota bacterium]
MSSKKPNTPWSKDYEAPKLFSISGGFQQALGISTCANGTNANGGRGACNTGESASGTTGEPNACASGYSASGSMGGGYSCGMGNAPGAF